MSKSAKYKIDLSNGKSLYLENVDLRDHYDGWDYFYVGEVVYQFNLKHVTLITKF